MHIQVGELQSALQYQVLSTGLQHGHFLVMVGEVQYQQWRVLPLKKQVSMASMECTNDYILYNDMKSGGGCSGLLLHPSVTCVQWLAISFAP